MKQEIEYLRWPPLAMRYKATQAEYPTGREIATKINEIVDVLNDLLKRERESHETY